MPLPRIGVALAVAATLTAPALARPAADDLRDRLGAIFDTTDVNALWAAKVVSLDTGQVIFERNPRLLVMPASTMKVVTLAVAAERLGWDARFTTRLETTGAIEDGVLRGDLIVTGDGDPTIGEREDAPRVLDAWASRLAMLGVTRIDGRLIGDDDVLPDQALGAGWAWDDLAFGFAAPVGALQFHEGSAQVVISPGPRPDTPASFRLEPASTDLVLTGEVTTTGPDTPAAVFTRRRPFSRTLEVTGNVPRGRDYVRTVSTDNPTRGLLLAFRDTLARFGIAVSGDVADIDEVGEKPAGPRRLLYLHESAPLREIGIRLMKVSQNLIAETLRARIGLTSDVPDVDPLAAASGAYERTLATWGVPIEDVILADGSGLSRYDYVTADALVTVLRHMAQDPRHAAIFQATLPILGVDGTLEHRLRGTRAEGRVHAKTGSMTNVRALAGYMTTIAGERLVFAIVANNFKVRGSAIDAVTDRALDALVAKDRGCCGSGTGSR